MYRHSQTLQQYQQVRCGAGRGEEGRGGVERAGERI